MKRQRALETGEFVARQFASLVADGCDEQVARARIGQVLGTDALKFIDGTQRDGAESAATLPVKLAFAAGEAGGDKAAVQAALVRSLGEARLFALDWWRPVRTFLLYIVLLLAIAVFLAAFYLVDLLPKFFTFSQLMQVRSGGVAGWILAGHGWRLIAPLVLMAVLILVFFIGMWGIRFRVARLQSLPGVSRIPWLYGRSGSRYRNLLVLEYLSILHGAGASLATVLGIIPGLIKWREGRSFRYWPASPVSCVEKAGDLGTVDDELDWQRRMAWSAAQAQMELSRDRLILFFRVGFYILVGYLVTVLYMPIFTLAASFRGI